MTPEEKMTAARCRLFCIVPWYGSIAMQMEWAKMPESWEMQTMGVAARGNNIVCYWSEQFVIDHSIPELVATIQHEIEHVVRLHICRRYSREPRIWNIAADMCVNGAKSDPRIGYDTNNGKVFPIDANNMIWIPDGWAREETTETYYDKLIKDGTQIKGQQFDCHEGWERSEMSDDQIRQMVASIVHEATSQHPGTVPAHLQLAISALGKPIVNWRTALRKHIGRYCGNTRKTLSRRNRRQDVFGLPGHSHHAASKATVIVDTSGSISKQMLETFFTEIESMLYRTKVRLLLWDAAYEGFFPNYRKGDWNKIKISGGGGTDMEAPIDWIEENRVVGNVNILLTDGYCSYASPRNYPMITCVCTKDGNRPGWGKVLELLN